MVKAFKHLTESVKLRNVQLKSKNKKKKGGAMEGDAPLGYSYIS